MTPQHARFLEKAIAPQLVRLSLPVLAVLALQTLVGIAETYFVSRLGIDAVAGVAIVFPVFMLMTKCPTEASVAAFPLRWRGRWEPGVCGTRTRWSPMRW